MLPPIVLASQSPRRKEILTTAGIPFIVRVSAVPEVRGARESPREYVRRLAREKAVAVAEAGEVILGADTTVVLGDAVLEKPRDPAEARQMLGILSGREHTVLTGVCILHPAGVMEEVESTSVRFAELTSEEIEDYVASGEPMDKAGAYGIQGLASKFVGRIEGCYFNIMGLPIARVYRMLQRLPQI